MKLTVANVTSQPKLQLVAECEKRGLISTGNKPDLVARLLVELRQEERKAKEEIGQEWKDEIEEDLVQSLGTKLASTLQFLKRLLYKQPSTARKAKILLFSQFSSFLHKVGNFLAANGIDNVFIEGAIGKKENAIANFKSGDIQVMMLSLDHAASGTNLTEATHVILLDPIQGTYDEAKAIEDQAIGRAYRQGQSESVTVVRLLIQDTIEHAQYLERFENQDMQKSTEAIEIENEDENEEMDEELQVNQVMVSRPAQKPIKVTRAKTAPIAPQRKPNARVDKWEARIKYEEQEKQLRAAEQMAARKRRKATQPQQRALPLPSTSEDRKSVV